MKASAYPFYASAEAVEESQSQHKAAFTLAEMMVVMLIASIILACMAPIMTTKMKADQSIQTSPWRWAKDNVNAYYSASSNQAAMIGQNTRGDTDNAKLIINNATDLDDMILFKNGTSTLGHLQLTKFRLLLGTLASGVTPNSSSIAIGQDLTPTGANVIALGTGAQATALKSIAIGSNASAMGSSGISIGNMAGSTVQNSEARVIAIGLNTLRKNTSGTDNIAIGRSALNANTTGSNNNAFGSYTLQANTLGSDNTAVGYASLRQNKTGDDNTAIGSNALYNTTAGSNTAVGSYALTSNTTGENNTAIGYLSLKNNTTGSNNIAIGNETFFNGSVNPAIGNQTGNNNTAIGYAACQNVLGSNKTCIGAYSGPDSGHAWASATDTTERIFIGSKSVYNGGPAALEIHNGLPFQPKIASGRGLADTVVVVNGALLVKGGIISSIPDAKNVKFDGRGGVFMVGKTNGKEQLEQIHLDWNGNSGEVSGLFGSQANGYFKSPDGGSNFAFPSDRRLKNVGNENLDGLAKLRQLKIYNFTFKKDKDKIPQVGVMAQDLQKVFPHAVSKGTDGFLRIRLEDMFYAVINAIKELDIKYQKQEKQLEEQKLIIKQLQEDNKMLKARLNKLEAKIK